MDDLDREPTKEDLNKALDYIRSVEGKLYDRLKKDPNDTQAKEGIAMSIREINNLKDRLAEY